MMMHPSEHDPTHCRRDRTLRSRAPVNTDLLVMVDATGTSSDVSARLVDAAGFMQMAVDDVAGAPPLHTDTIR